MENSYKIQILDVITDLIESDSVSSKYKHVWHKLYEKCTNSPKPLVIYGCGKYTKNLICQNILEKEGPHINKILDDNAIDGQTLAGIPVIKTSDFDFSKESIIFISSIPLLNELKKNFQSAIFELIFL